MPHPLLEGADIDAVLQVPGGVGVAELVQEPAPAVRAGVAAVDALGAVLELLRGGAVAAVQLAAPRHALELFQHGAVGAAGGAWKQRIVGGCTRGAEFLKHGDQLLRHRDFPLLPVLGLKSPVRFRGDAHGGMAEVNVAPCDEAPLSIAFNASGGLCHTFLNELPNRHDQKRLHLFQSLTNGGLCHAFLNKLPNRHDQKRLPMRQRVCLHNPADRLTWPSSFQSFNIAFRCAESGRILTICQSIQK